ncbi:hypothetical protein PXC01_18360 [Maribacter sp. M208]|uniref:hypothetical protein n=1 Tax=Maribacter huludaoensis TaxID=3030010 RepID=UPI0023ECBC5F|nr:hypothetical protein [Maribacter huludaoensis]MDF4223566.1 hypothetical protein [Maribacter huludaoensis]
MNLVKEDGFKIDKLVPILGTLTFGAFCLIPVINLAKRRKFSSEIISIENESLVIRSQLFSPVKTIELSDIKSIKLWRETRSNKQYLISQTLQDKPNILDQLRGKHLYITDTIVDVHDLDELITELNKKVPNNSYKA